MKNILLTVSLFAIILLPIALWLAWTPTAEENYNTVVNEHQFEDSLLNYRLTKDSLILEFDRPIKHKDVLGEVYLFYPPYSNYYVHTLSPKNKKKGYLGKFEFEGNKIVFGNLGLKEEILDSVVVKMTYSPHFVGCSAYEQIYTGMYTFVSSKYDNKMDLLYGDEIDDFTIRTIDLFALKQMSEGGRNDCLELIESRLGFRIPEEEILKSSRTWPYSAGE